MTSSNPLDQHELSRLEGAAKELNAHIRKRRRIFRPSTPRRLFGLLFSVPMIAAGLIFGLRAINLGYVLGPPIFASGLLFIAGAMWLYCDWFE